MQEGCDRNKTIAGCVTSPPFPPVRMNLLSPNDRICGELSGVPFVNATRPIRDEEGAYACPKDMKPCLEDADPEITFCIPELEPKERRCPYTDMQILDLSKP